MLSNAYFLAKFRFDTTENEPAKSLQKFANFASFANPHPLSRTSEVSCERASRSIGHDGLPLTVHFSIKSSGLYETFCPIQFWVLQKMNAFSETNRERLSLIRDCQHISKPGRFQSFQSLTGSGDVSRVMFTSASAPSSERGLDRLT